MRVIPEPEKFSLNPAPLIVGMGIKNWKKNGSGVGTLKMGMGRVWVGV